MRKPLMLGLVMMIFIGLVASRPAAAQSSDAVLLIPGIPGSSLDERHKNWIEALSVSHGLASIEGKKLTVACSLSVVKLLDVSGPLLWAAAAVGQVLDQHEDRVDPDRRSARRSAGRSAARTRRPADPRAAARAL